MSDLDVAVVGAGPYGLSAGVHLQSAGVGVRVFGEPMEFWAHKMPAGMLLRSPRVASNLSDPGNRYTLDRFEHENSVQPRAPLPLETFVDYGRWFRRHLGENHDSRLVRSVERSGSHFRVRLQDGEDLTARSVVVAAGIGNFRKLPAVLDGLDPKYASHCYQGVDLRRLAGKSVAVIGAGQSALECAALLHEAGAQVEVLARQSTLKWIGVHKWLHQMGPLSNMLYSKHDVGPIAVSRLVAYPNVVSHVPLKLRDKIRVRAVRPAGSRWLPDRLSKVKIFTSVSLQRVSVIQNRLQLVLDDGSDRIVDHVLCGTGYRVDVSRYAFLSPEILGSLTQFDGYPRLMRGFSTSVPGLHFIGAPAARTFGPLLYFVAGTEFASKELTAELKRKRTATEVRSQVAAGRI